MFVLCIPRSRGVYSEVPRTHISASDELRGLCRSLFGGAQYRLEVGDAVAVGDGLVCIKDLAQQLGDPPDSGSVNAELKMREKGGLLVRVPRENGEPRVYIIRQDSAYWTLCQEMAARCGVA